MIKNGCAVRFYFWSLFANLNFLNFIACAIVQCIWFFHLNFASHHQIHQKHQKMTKSKTLLRAHFWSNFVQTFLDDAKLPKFCDKCFSVSKQSNIGCICLICMWKVMKGWSDNYEIYTMYSSCHIEKKNRKPKNCPGSPSLWILHLKFANIFITWIKAKIFGFIFKGSGQLVPSFWFTSFPQPV